VDTLVADLQDLDQVKGVADSVPAKCPTLDVLICNAGIHDGFEMLFPTPQGCDLVSRTTILLCEKVHLLLSKSLRRRLRCIGLLLLKRELLVATIVAALRIGLSRLPLKLNRHLQSWNKRQGHRSESLVHLVTESRNLTKPIPMIPSKTNGRWHKRY
jgi:NAD(P)-dependent dehydrogenase (short-subunit alcohol dehydrogenase family)